MPRLEKVRAERNQYFGLIDSIGRQIAAAEKHLCRRAGRLIVDCFVKYRARRIVRTDEGSRYLFEGRPLRRAEERDAILARLRRPAEPVAEHLLGFVPRHFPQRTVAAANLRTRQPVRIVQPLQRRLPPRTQTALTDRIRGISLELDHPPFADSRDHAASRRTLGTGRREKTGDAGDDVLVRHHVRDKLARRRLASRHRRRRSRSRGQLDERSPGYRGSLAHRFFHFPHSVMTADAIERRFFLRVTVHAKSHVDFVHRYHPIHRLHRTVTALAFDTGMYMRPMREAHEVRQRVHAIPLDLERRRRLVSPRPRHRPYPAARNPVAVTSDASRHRRNPRFRRPSRIGMAVLAGNLVHPGMHVMAEWYRLDDVCARRPRPLGQCDHRSARDEHQEGQRED